MKPTNYYCVRILVCGYTHKIYCSATSHCHAVQVAFRVLMSQGYSLDDIVYDRFDERCFCEHITIYKYSNF